MRYAIYDNAAKTWVWNHNTGEKINFKHLHNAEGWIDDYLAAGNYIDKPRNVLEVREVTDEFITLA